MNTRETQAPRDTSAPSIGRVPILRQGGLAQRDKVGAERLLRFAERQHGAFTAVGHTALSIEGRLFAALLYGGDEAVLSHTTAAWIWSLVDSVPTRTHLIVPGRRRSLPDVRIHHSRRVEAVERRGFQVTPVGRTLLDLASMITPRQLRRALAEADYRGLLEQGELEAALGKGRSGSTNLKSALARHFPQLAKTLSVLEERFLELCQLPACRRPR